MRTCVKCRALAPETATACPACGTAFAAARFRLHPSTAEEIAPPPPPPPTFAPRPAEPSYSWTPPPTPPPATPMPAAVAPAPAPTGGPLVQAKARWAAATPGQRKLVVLGAVGVVVMLIVAGFWYGTSETARYPDRYLLEEDEMPAGWRAVSLPQEARNELGITENPGKMGPSGLENLASDTGIRAKEGYAQTLGRSGLFDAVIVFALRFSTDAQADDWVRDARSNCDDGGRLLQDRSVVVLVVSASRNDADAERVANQILDKAPRLSDAC